MSDPVPMFEPMEWAVLVTGTGGRLFQVETTTFHGDMQRVHEYYIQPGDTKTRYSMYGGLGSPYTSLIKCPDKEIAEKCAVDLCKAYAQLDKAASAATYARDRGVEHIADIWREILTKGVKSNDYTK